MFQTPNKFVVGEIQLVLDVALGKQRQVEWKRRQVGGGTVNV